jgi:hypothetical protein
MDPDKIGLILSDCETDRKTKLVGNEKKNVATKLMMVFYVQL